LPTVIFRARNFCYVVSRFYAETSAKYSTRIAHDPDEAF